LTIERSLEQRIIESRVETTSGVVSGLEPGLQGSWIKALSRSVAAVQEKGWFPIVLCSEAARSLVKSSSERELPELVILSVQELVSDITVEVIGEIKVES
jgi:flagellar biosynthesis protein FlhA